MNSNSILHDQLRPSSTHCRYPLIVDGAHRPRSAQPHLRATPTTSLLSDRQREDLCVASTETETDYTPDPKAKYTGLFEKEVDERDTPAEEDYGPREPQLGTVRRALTDPSKMRDIPVFMSAFTATSHSANSLPTFRTSTSTRPRSRPGTSGGLSRNGSSPRKLKGLSALETVDRLNDLLVAIIGIYQCCTTLQSVKTGLRGLSEDGKPVIGIGTISVVMRLTLELALEFEVAIAYDLALSAPESVFIDIIHALSILRLLTFGKPGRPEVLEHGANYAGSTQRSQGAAFPVGRQD
ncbi:Phosphatidylinositol 4-kinase [Mycena kentingensis (nom. inval.)]|nr:Phosphatidylinositol 4-kinase [Mycena kentingensis (nom. inval.)]